MGRGDVMQLYLWTMAAQYRKIYQLKNKALSEQLEEPELSFQIIEKLCNTCVSVSICHSDISNKFTPKQVLLGYFHLLYILVLT